MKNYQEADAAELYSTAFRLNQLAFCHLMRTATNGEEWAEERISNALSQLDAAMCEAPADMTCDEVTLQVIKSVDTTRPDGAIARSWIEV